MEHRKADLTQHELSETTAGLEGLQYYSMRIGSLTEQAMLMNDVHDETAYANKLNYFVEHMQYDLQLVQGEDTSSCVLYHFERNYSMAKHNDIVMAFKKSDSEEQDKMLIFNDRVLGTGPVKFIIEAENIRQLPELQVK